MILISFQIHGFGFYVKYSKDENIGIDQYGDEWTFLKGRLYHLHNSALSTNKFYSEPIKKVA